MTTELSISDSHGSSRATASASANAEAGPSSRRVNTPLAEEAVSVPEGFIRIASTGIEWYHYRRALFLAGTEPPTPVSATKEPLPEYITVPIPPSPLPPRPPVEVPPKLAKLDTVLSRKGAIRDPRVRDRVERVLDELRRGRVLGRGVTLSLMIKIYKYEWTLDGLWPVDPVTGEAAIPPDSPTPKTEVLS